MKVVLIIGGVLACVFILSLLQSFLYNSWLEKAWKRNQTSIGTLGFVCLITAFYKKDAPDYLVIVGAWFFAGSLLNLLAQIVNNTSKASDYDEREGESK